MAVGFSYTTDEGKICELAGVSLLEYYSDLKVMISAQDRANREVAQALGIVRQGYVLSRGHVLDAEVMGCQVEWPEQEEPWVVAPAIASEEEIRRFRPPDPDDNAVIRRELLLAKAFYELTGQKESMLYNGPVTVAAQCLGQDRFYTLAAGNTGLAEELVRRVNEAIIAWKQYHDREMGIEPGGNLGLADDGASLVSARLFRLLSLPYLQQWYKSFPSYAGRALHICGQTNHLLDQIAQLNLSIFDLGEAVDLMAARRQLPGTYLSRILDFRLVRDGTEAEITEYVGKELTTGAPGGNFGVHLEGWPGVPLWRANLVQLTVQRFNNTSDPVLKAAA